MTKNLVKSNLFTLENLKLILIPACLAAVYYPVFVKLVIDWSENDNYSHGFFIPFISAYMIYSRRDELRRLKIQPSNWGLLLLVLGLLQMILARTGSEFFMQRTSLIPVLLGISLFLLGTRITKKILFPIIFLIFMMPLPTIIWNKIAFPMQLFATMLTENVVRLIGIPVLREGNILYLAETTLEVVDACSGLRSLVTMFALSATFAWFADLSVLRKWILFILAAPIAILANIVRLTGTAALANQFGEKVAQGFLHELSGLVTFMLGLLLLGVIYWALLGKTKSSAKPN